MSSADLVESLRRILKAGGGGSNATAEALAAAGIKVTPYGARPDTPGARGQGINPAASTSGIASPLTEQKDDQGAPKREYYATQLKTSSDGLFVLPIKPIKTLNLKDAKGADVVIKLAEPKKAKP